MSDPANPRLLRPRRGGRGAHQHLGHEHARLYDRPYRGQLEREQWPLLRKIVEERDPERIGINTGAIQWAAGGLTHNLYKQLVHNLPTRYAERMQSAEPLVTRWLATLTDEEITTLEEVVRLGRGIIAECYSRVAITPCVTTMTDLEWFYWQHSADLGRKSRSSRSSMSFAATRRRGSWVRPIVPFVPAI